MRAVGVEDVVVPVGFEKGAVTVIVALVGGNPVGAVEYGKEIRKQIDEHQQEGPGTALTGGREKIVMAETVNKSNHQHAGRF